MPSFFKKFFLGKELSNPYVNQYHPGHRATSQPTQHVPNYVAPAMEPQPTSLTLPTRLLPRSSSRPVSPTFLEEARRLAGRDPVTGRVLSPEQYPAYDASSGQTTQTGWGKPQPYTNEQMRYNPYVTSRSAAVGGDWSQAVQERVEGDRRRTSRMDVQQERHDVTIREERRRRAEEERAQAERLREREVGGYFAPERNVREYYGGP